jgi:hypothetical protein
LGKAEGLEGSGWVLAEVLEGGEWPGDGGSVEVGRRGGGLGGLGRRGWGLEGRARGLGCGGVGQEGWVVGWKGLGDEAERAVAVNRADELDRSSLPSH